MGELSSAISSKGEGSMKQRECGMYEEDLIFLKVERLDPISNRIYSPNVVANVVWRGLAV